MHTLYRHINELAMPLGVCLAMMAVVTQLIMRRRQLGRPNPNLSNANRGVMILIVLFAAVLFGMVIARNLG